MKKFIEIWNDAEGDTYDAIVVDSDFIDLVELNATSLCVHVTNIQEQRTIYSREYPSKTKAHEAYIRLYIQLTEK